MEIMSNENIKKNSYKRKKTKFSQSSKMILLSNENINEENKENRFKSRKLKFYINNKKTSNNVPPKKKEKIYFLF
jgi:hypothetical protein